jgi:UDPglucose 6-dehydrogenase
MDILSAEMTKYAANAMLATRISFMNDMANLCELVGADINMVRKGIGSDQRIGGKFLYAGCGYGGSCFPKDVKALIQTADQNGYELRVLKAVEEVNVSQKQVLLHKLEKHFNGNISDKTICIWGLSFKPNTDDMREAPSLVLIEKLLKARCNIRVFDPVAMHEAKTIIHSKMASLIKSDSSNIYFANDIYDAVLDADALLLVTEWKEFRMPSWGVVKKSMKGTLILDGRNIYDKNEMKELGFVYEPIG